MNWSKSKVAYSIVELNDWGSLIMRIPIHCKALLLLQIILFLVRKSVSLNDLSCATSIYTLCVKGDMYYKERGSLKTAPESALETVLERGLKSRLKSGLKILEHIQNNPQFLGQSLLLPLRYLRHIRCQTLPS